MSLERNAQTAPARRSPLGARLGPILGASACFALFWTMIVDDLDRDAARLIDRLAVEQGIADAATAERLGLLSVRPAQPTARPASAEDRDGWRLRRGRLVWVATVQSAGAGDPRPLAIETDVTSALRAAAVLSLLAWAFGRALVWAAGPARPEPSPATADDAASESPPAPTDAVRDGLTGLATRTLYRGRLDADLAALADGRADDVILILVDADDFKFINDTYGHDAGDAVLVEIGARLTAVMDGVGGHAARLGGDEFAAAARVSDAWPTAEAIGDALQAQIAAPFTFAGVRIQLKTSVGVARASSVVDIDASRLIKAADVALYAAKRAGKSQYRVFDDALNATMDRRTELIGALPKAIEIGDLRPVLQPRIELQTGRLVGFEALSRWSWRGQDVSAGEFVALSEEIGIVDQLDVALFEKAVEAFAPFAAESGRPLALSANMTPSTLLSDGVPQRLCEIACDAGVDATRLAIECDERLFGKDWDALRLVLDALQEHGFAVSLDNFGVGASSISSLSRYSFNSVTIDRTFVNSLYAEPGNMIVFNHLNEMARDLGAQIIAQGLETLEMAEFVRHLGAEIGQGHLFAGPLEVAEIPPFLDALDERPISEQAKDALSA